MKESDSKLVKKFLDGDDSAFEDLLLKYLKPIYNFIFRLVGRKETAEDLTQETFLKVWKNISRFNENRNFKVWIFIIAKNAAYDHLKKKKALPFSFFADGGGENKLNKISGKISTEEIFEEKEATRNFEKILNKVPHHYKTILMLHYKEDFSLHEIAEILGKPYNTVKSQHQRALKHFKKKFLIS